MSDTQKQTLLDMLRDEYGITTMEQLDNAIKDMEKIDISPFVCRLEDCK